MTTLFSWLSVDNRGPSAIYIVSDSRLTWASAKQRWDNGRKVFSTASPDIFGYCGEVLFPSLVLGQLSDLIDRNLLWLEDCDAENRHAIFLDRLKASFDRRYNAPNRDFTIIHCARDREGLESKFHSWQVNYSAQNDSWSDSVIDVSNNGSSRRLVTLGSGKQSFEKELDSWNGTPQGGTARAIFSAFCDALAKGDDPLSGGKPQLVSLDRKSGGKVLGFVSEKTRYVYGLPIEFLPTHTDIEWVDELFQRVAPGTLELLSKAQRHARVDKPDPGGFLKFFRRISR